MATSSKEVVVMYDSPEAATFRTDIAGWVSREGHFHGNGPYAEHLARWSGCTHFTCGCGAMAPRHQTVCDSCYARKRTEKYYALPLVEWDGMAAVCTWDDDRFFFDYESVLDWMAKLDLEDGKRPEVQLVLCIPGQFHLLDAEVWADDLPEDGELPDEVQIKVDELNEALCNAGTICWWPGNQRIDVDALWKELDKDKDKETNA